jgi:hypothetical protein
VSIGASFLSSLSLTLNNNGTKKQLAKSDYNAIHLEALITPGWEYQLELRAGTTQLRQPNGIGFPPCIFYDLEVMAIESAPPLSCDLPSLPKDLSGPQYLGSSNRVHVQKQFLVPRKPGGFDTEETMSFQVRTRFMCRAFTTPFAAIGI